MHTIAVLSLLSLLWVDFLLVAECCGQIQISPVHAHKQTKGHNEILLGFPTNLRRVINLT